MGSHRAPVPQAHRLLLGTRKGTLPSAGRRKEGREREGKRKGKGKEGREGGWWHRVSRAAPPPPPPVHRHRIPWERAPSAAV